MASGQIVRTNSTLGAGVLFAAEKDGTLRLCIDYRALNKITVKYIYTLPRIEEILDSFANARYYTRLDLQQGYHQIRMHPEHAKRTAFQTKFGSFNFLVMPFGLANAPTFQRTMDHLLHEFRSFCHAYLDDIVIYSNSLEEHLTHM